ncbi:MAG TPA: serine protease, partial [Allocoleopsis sp.]
MKKSTLNLLISLFILSPLSFSLTGCNSFNKPQNPPQHNQKTPLSRQSIRQIAKNITVNIRIDKVASGTGTLIKKEGNLYTVLTNLHVVKFQKNFQIETPDYKVYNAKLLPTNSNYDLALLQFSSDSDYQVANIADFNSLSLNNKLYAVGFPYNSIDLTISEGTFSMFPNKSLKEGYQIGYTNEILQGMSGGAILDDLGNLVGINGRMANPIIPNYTYFDNTKPDANLTKQMMALSWGIPIKTVNDFAPDLALNPNNNPLNDDGKIVSNPPNLANLESEIAKKVNQNAAGFTVKIKANDGEGSGVIIAKNNQTYYLVTANH